MSNSVFPITCDTPQWYYELREDLVYVAYYVVPIMYLLISIIPSSFAAVAFCRRYHNVAGYIYQRIYICHTVLHGLFAVTFIFVGRRWSGQGLPGKSWYMSNYALMWYAARLASPILNAVNLVSIFLLTSMAIDRLIAMSMPMRYQTLNKLKLGIGLAIASYLIGFTTSLFDISRLKVMDDNATVYRIELNTEYTTQPMAQVLSNVRNSLNILCMCTVAICNSITVVLFVRHRRKTFHTLGNGQSTEARERERKVERSLLVLAVSQGCMLLLEEPFVVGYFVLIYMRPDIFVCLSPLLQPGVEGFTQLCHTLHIFNLFIFNKPFKDLLLEIPFLAQLLKCRMSRDTTSINRIAPIGDQSRNSERNAI